jgi:hypothetical protein
VIPVAGETMPVFADEDHLLTMWHGGDKIEIREHSPLPADVIAVACGLLKRELDDSEWNQYFVGEFDGRSVLGSDEGVRSRS